MNTMGNIWNTEATLGQMAQNEGDIHECFCMSEALTRS